uniref:Spexin isoform X2 n=1 Tax=Geotrypetes seraphini TaxID=260995 RepID=A0A6P8RUR0_GEOSA|nr:spexin isoform X2 [Geotrypetes seraphini]
MLYLKGAYGHGFTSDESQRKSLSDQLQLETRSQNSNLITASEAAELFLSILQNPQENGEGRSKSKALFLVDVRSYLTSLVNGRSKLHQDF